MTVWFVVVFLLLSDGRVQPLPPVEFQNTRDCHRYASWIKSRETLARKDTYKIVGHAAECIELTGEPGTDI